MKHAEVTFYMPENDEIRFDCSTDNNVTREDMVCMFLEALDTMLQVGGAATLESAMNRIKPRVLESALLAFASDRLRFSQLAKL